MLGIELIVSSDITSRPPVEAINSMTPRSNKSSFFSSISYTVSLSEVT